MKKWFNDSADGGSNGDISKKNTEGVSPPESEGKPRKWITIDTNEPRKSKKINGGGNFSSEEPADDYSSESEGTPKKWMLIDRKRTWSVKKRIIVSCISVAAAVLLGAGIFVITLLVHPTITLDPIADQSPLPGASSTPQYSDGQLVTPTPTVDPYAALMNRSDMSILQHTVNILLIGVDYAPERTDWGGKKAYHSDVMIVLAINTETNEVNMISLPRDTYTRIPGVKGIYKLNASIDCGGGWDTRSNPNPNCFDKVCESASWMLGGIPIKYYYAVDMTAVKGLVDNMDGGGLEYDCDIDFSIQGRSYKKGLQHMNGQAVLDYLRVRKSADGSHEGITDGDTGDTNRVKRQKNMLVAIFKTLKSSGQLYNVDTMISAFSGNLFTNVPIDQTAALAAYAANVDPANIKMNSMVGYSINSKRPTFNGRGPTFNIFNWNFVITDQKKRVDLIRQIYGDAAIELYNIHQYSLMTYEYVTMMWEQMQIEVVLNASRPLLDQAKGILDADKALPDYPTPSLTEPVPAGSADPEASPTETPIPTPSPTPLSSEGFRKYPEGGEVWTAYLRAEAAYLQLSAWDYENTSDQHLTDTYTLKNQLKLDIQTLYSRLSLGAPRTQANWDSKVWHVIYGDDRNKVKPNQSLVSNEIPVDFN